MPEAIVYIAQLPEERDLSRRLTSTVTFLDESINPSIIEASSLESLPEILSGDEPIISDPTERIAIVVFNEEPLSPIITAALQAAREKFSRVTVFDVTPGHDLPIAGSIPIDRPRHQDYSRKSAEQVIAALSQPQG